MWFNVHHWYHNCYYCEWIKTACYIALLNTHYNTPSLPTLDLEWVLIALPSTASSYKSSSSNKLRQNASHPGWDCKRINLSQLSSWRTNSRHNKCCWGQIFVFSCVTLQPRDNKQVCCWGRTCAHFHTHRHIYWCIMPECNSSVTSRSRRACVKTALRWSCVQMCMLECDSGIWFLQSKNHREL